MDKSQVLTPQQVGLSTLENLNRASSFNEWMYETILPYAKGEILEIGSGIGNISEFFIRQGIPLHMSDLRPGYCQALRSKFASNPSTRDIYELDLADPDLSANHSDLIGKFDTVFALNVVEHISDHRLALANCNKLLSPGGHVIILVPAYRMLYNVLDRELEHFRRYTKTSLRKLLALDFELIHSQYFNFVGTIGWFLAGTVGRKKTIPEGPLTLYDRMIPICKIIDQAVLNQAGLSVIAVGRKKQA